MSDEMIRLAVGLAIPILLAPFAIMGLRKLFAIFLAEGIELFSTQSLGGEDAKRVSRRMGWICLTATLVIRRMRWACASWSTVAGSLFGRKLGWRHQP